MKPNLSMSHHSTLSLQATLFIHMKEASVAWHYSVKAYSDEADFQYFIRCTCQFF